MTTDALDLHAATAALIDVAGGDTDAWTRVPVPLRAALAAVALAASARTVNGVTLARTGRYSRGTASRTDSPWRHLIAALADNSQTLVDLLLDEAADGPDPTRPPPTSPHATASSPTCATSSPTRRRLFGRSRTTPTTSPPNYASTRDDERAALEAKIVHLRIIE